VKENILSPFRYYGAKYNSLDFILENLCHTKIYVDLFGGSGAILLNKRESVIEIFNDLNIDIINFFSVLREQREKLIDFLYLTPFSELEYKKAFYSLHKGTQLERARKFFTCANQSFTATTARIQGWRLDIKTSNKFTTKNVEALENKIKNLPAIIDRLKYVQLSNQDFRKLIPKVDSSETLIYCDPPYLHSTRGSNREYKHEMKIKDHIAFLEMIKECDSKIAISGYSSSLYNSYLGDWYRLEDNEHINTLGNNQKKKKEILWLNYNPEFKQLNLFERKKI